MVKARKVEWVEQLKDLIERNSYMVFTNFRGMTVEETEKLRQELYENDSSFHVVKNRLARRAFAETSPAKSETEGEADETSTETAELTDVQGVGPSKAKTLEEAGLESVKDLVDAGQEELQEVPGVGPAMAEKILGSAHELVPDTASETSAAPDSGNGLVDRVEPLLQGNTAIVFGDSAVSRMAEIIVDFQEEYENPRLKAGIIDSEFFEAEEIERIAELPTRHELLTSVAMGLNSPLQKLAQYLKNPIVKFTNVLNQVKNQKEDQEE